MASKLHRPRTWSRAWKRREEARQKALEGIKAAGAKDWRALAEWLKLTFPEHRSGHSISASATANAQQAVVVTDQPPQSEPPPSKELPLDPDAPPWETQPVHPYGRRWAKHGRVGSTV